MAHSDQFVIAEYLYAALNVSAITTLATGGVHRSYAPPGAVEPYVIIRPVPGGTDLMVVGTTRVWYRGTWDVLAVSRDDLDLADRIAAEIDAILHGENGRATTSGTVFECTRTNPIFFEEPDEGIRYCYSGGEYRIAARAA